MSRKAKSAPATRNLTGPIFLTLLCLFVWACLLTYSVGDWPNPGIYPHNDPTQNCCGRFGAWVAYTLLYWLGDGAYPLALFGTFAACLWLIHGKIVQLLQRGLGLIVLVACTSASVALISSPGSATLAPGDGGMLGAGLSRVMVQSFGSIGTALVLVYSFVVGLVFVAEGWVLRLPSAVQRIREASEGAISATREVVSAALPAPVPAGAPAGAPEKSDEREEAVVKVNRPALKINPGRPSSTAAAPSESQGTLLPAENDEPHAKPAAAEKSASAGEDTRKEPKLTVRAPIEDRKPAEPYPKPIGSWSFPPLEILREPEYGFSAQQESLVRAKAKLLEQTLEEFRLDARVVEIDTGPVITMFELQLGTGIKVSQVASLSNDIARALKAPAVRVVAPIPGKNTIGIEVPNVDKEQVRLKELLTLAAGKAQKMALPIFLGKDASGAVLLADLATMPHMLIAGTTGSGKSVCINSIIASFLMTQRPDEVKLILVDPKMVELAAFKDVPHLMSPIITDMARAEQILDWAVTKMEERYELLAEGRVRNIASYNKLGAEEIYRRFQPTTEQEKAQIPVRLPYIVVIIDELADLMMTSAKEVEHHLARLAQKSRAVGIHIVVATQRPEAKVVTGLIKSNMPCRVAFRVASRMDSRIVLDQNGAEVLMGQGDMLFLPPASSKLIRAQGTLLDEQELHRMIEHLATQARPEYHPQLMRIKPKGLSESGERDPLFDDAVQIVLESRRGSVSLLQRRLSIGYSRASRLIDEMAEAGVVGEFKGSQAREVVMTLEEWESLKAEAARSGSADDGPDVVLVDESDDDTDDEEEDDELDES